MLPLLIFAFLSGAIFGGWIILMHVEERRGHHGGSGKSSEEEGSRDGTA
jgi:hypothetical protein